ncbi:hypothetical protein Hamer_G005644 [Homarus americanus]|uniref:Uncharacterized protein n=1 Tax=Homarus americanus TaxID=6706 RepID=A0A8J5K329_HOMAM|nr:hypothetical protein Hamer_G005644 [Homarus americanus]
MHELLPLGVSLTQAGQQQQHQGSHIAPPHMRDAHHDLHMSCPPPSSLQEYPPCSLSQLHPQQQPLTVHHMNHDAKKTVPGWPVSLQPPISTVNMNNLARFPSPPRQRRQACVTVRITLTVTRGFGFSKIQALIFITYCT